MSADPSSEAVTIVGLGKSQPAEAGVRDVRPGTKIGRFVVGEELGRGAMGVVLAALDPDLERRVAIKLLSLGFPGSSADMARARLLREARAMAQLSHPNVVTVYEVGTWEEQVYVVMELIDGPTLRAWMHEDHAAAAIAATFAAAGRGLAAAHKAGILHRDFKPENVLVGNDGRVRVTDFGLAASAGPSATKEPSVDVTDSGSRPFAEVATTLTQTGSVVGTPAYMSPEQFAGDTLDPRADQFSFCVALYEAFFGARPFDATTLPALAQAVQSGQLRAMPTRNPVPRRWKDVVVRGLSVDREDRHRSMDVLVAELTRRPWWRRAAWIVAAAGVAGFAGVAGTVAFDRPCAGAGTEAVRTWNDAREEVRAAFVASSRKHAESSFAAVDTELTAYAERWSETSAESCRAANIERTESPALFDRRMRCLQRRHAALGAMVARLKVADAKVVDKSVRAVQRLPPILGCADEEALMSVVAAPKDEATRARVEALQPKVDAAVTQLNLGEYDEGLEAIEAVAAEAADLDYSPLRASIALQLGNLRYRKADLEGAEDALRDAVEHAARSKDAALEAQGWITLVYVVGYRQGRRDEGLGLGTAAEGAIVRAGSPPLLRGRLANNLALMQWEAGRYDDAEAKAREAIALLSEAMGPEAVDVASSTQTLGNILREASRLEEARTQFEHSLAIRERVLGPHHELVANALNDLGTVLEDLEPESARDVYERSISIREGALGLEHPRTADSYSNLGNHLRHVGDLDGSREYLERALAIYEVAYGKDGAQAAAGLVNLAATVEEQGDVLGSLKMVERAVEIGRKTWGNDHPNLAIALDNLGTGRIAAGMYREAEDALAESLRVREGALAPDHLDTAKSLFNLASVKRLLEEYDDSRELFGRAREIYAARYHPEHPEVASVDEQLGLVFESEERYEQAREAYARALAMYEKELGADSVSLASPLANLADAIAAAGDPKAALEHYDRALALREKEMGVEHPEICYALIGRGNARLAVARTDEGLADLERCVALRSEKGADAFELAFARFELAKALRTARRESARAKELAMLARQGFEAGGDVGAPNVEEIDAWLPR